MAEFSRSRRDRPLRCLFTAAVKPGIVSLCGACISFKIVSYSVGCDEEQEKRLSYWFQMAQHSLLTLVVKPFFFLENLMFFAKTKTSRKRLWLPADNRTKSFDKLK